ncbi:1-deoxy-D-xylulose-5-phosphate reductoisomerase [Candidatus Peregrinibacteria bacterium]|jgi:1-deoxy-D-xylulose-5-phosphate reductoisomerase|nr:1-deoxy-D-xylulose-5-phosphate reductoisomerase [Candidatus Peregrinibacteria bacterium]
MKCISILGSTGSIGTQTLDVVRKSKGAFRVLGLSTNTNIELLEKQADEFGLKNLAVFCEEAARKLQEERKDLHIQKGVEGLLSIATLKEVETVVVSLVGKIGLEPTLAAIQAKKDIALANKETLVVSGIEVMEMAKKYGVNICPIDSEHSAIAQCMRSGRRSEVHKIWLTCSGGPFRNAKKWPLEKLERVTQEEALAHPTWSMGKKISIDSATLANKGLEFIEAMRLFDLDPNQIEVVIHPQSIVHSAVEFKDGSILAEMGATDMRRCIAYALYAENRQDINLKRLSLFDLNLSFEKPDYERFPCLSYAIAAAKKSQEACKAFNNANEAAVADFLSGEIGFMEIGKNIKSFLLL